MNKLPTVTSQAVNQNPGNLDPRDPFPGIQARPLAMPDFANIRSKNPQLALRWVNRMAGGGMRLDQMTFAGFVPATPAECEMPDGKGGWKAVPESLIKNGQIINGDCTCMKIPRAAYDGALKYNWERAINRLKPGTDKTTGAETLRNTLKDAGIRQTPDLSKKLSAFQPTEEEIAKMEREGKPLQEGGKN